MSAAPKRDRWSWNEWLLAAALLFVLFGGLGYLLVTGAAK